MTKRFVLLLFAGLLILVQPYAYCIELADLPAPDTLTFKNPFRSLLPKKEEEVKIVEPTKPEKKEEPKPVEPQKPPPEPKKPEIAKPQPPPVEPPVLPPAEPPVKVTEEKKEAPPVIIEPPSLTISGLVWNSDRPQAIVNNQIVGIGDVVAGSEILEIQKTGIGIQYQGQKFIIEKN